MLHVRVLRVKVVMVARSSTCLMVDFREVKEEPGSTADREHVVRVRCCG